MTTTKAATKRAERERRRAAGEVRVECWVSERDAAWISSMAKDAEVTKGAMVKMLLSGKYCT